MLSKKREPTIQLKDYEIPLDAQAETQVSQKDMIGWTPYVQFKSMPIDSAQIVYFKMESTGLIPEFELIFVDNMVQFRSENFALDNDIISVYINSRMGSLRDIKMDFKIVDYNYNRDEDLIYVKGIIDVGVAYIENRRAYRGLTSYEVLDDIAQTLQLGFVSNIDSTDDAMTWINPLRKISDFVADVTQHAYKNETGFFWSFVDFYYNLTFLDVQIEMNEDSSKKVGPIDPGMPYESDKNQTVAPIILEYAKQVQQNSNLMFYEYEVFNQSTNKSIESGYRKNISFYDINGNPEKRVGGWVEFILETAQSPGAADENIILKSTPDDTKQFYRFNTHSHYLGKIDVENVHPNYLVAKAQNIFNISELEKIYIVITLRNPNFMLQRFTKVRIDIKDVSFPGYDANRNIRLSGSYLITGIIFEMDKEQGFVQKVVLCRRELTSKNLDL